MEFYKKLYIGKSLSKRADKIIEQLKRQQFPFFLYVITIPLMKDGMLEIYPAYILKQKIYRQMNVKVVGLAGSRSEALELVQMIVDECLSKNGNVELSHYFVFD